MQHKKRKPLISQGFSDAAGRTRTGTVVHRLILSQVRLPIPPQRLVIFNRHSFYHSPSYYASTFFSLQTICVTVQPFAIFVFPSFPSHFTIKHK
jgi:hypothetical protein